MADVTAQHFEKEKWDKYYSDATNKPTTQELYSKRNVIFDEDAAQIIRHCFPENRPISIAEAGCGSGIATYELALRIPTNDITLIDISQNALRFSEMYEPKLLNGKVKRILSDITTLPLKDNSVDLCWNIGVIEHYSLPIIEQIVTEMARITRPGGIIAIAIPNRNNIATLKAALLGSTFGRSWLNFIPGYRFDSEIRYRNQELAETLSTVVGTTCNITYAGSCLWYSAPDFLVVLADKLLNRSPLSFLSFFILRKF